MKYTMSEPTAFVSRQPTRRHRQPTESRAAGLETMTDMSIFRACHQSDVVSTRRLPSHQQRLKHRYGGIGSPTVEPITRIQVEIE